MRMRAESFTGMPFGSMHELVEVEDGQQDREHDEQHHHAHHQDEQGFEYTQHGGDEGLQFPLLVGGGAFQHGVELAAGFAAGDEMHHDGGEQAAAAEGLADGGAFTHPAGGV